MAFQVVPQGVEVVVNQRLHSEDLVNVLWVAAAQPQDGFVLASIAGTVTDWWNAALAPFLSNELFLISVVARDMSMEGGIQSVQLPPPNSQGDVGTPALPSNVAFAITHRTARVGRSYRGRSYVAGLPENAVAGNTLAGATVTGLIAAFNTLRADLDNNGFLFSVCSRRNQGVLRAQGVLTPVSTSTAVDARVDSQRRRLS